MKMSDDDSPILRRGGRNRGKAPVIVPSPDSLSQRPSKLAVPPSPGTPGFFALPISLPVPPSPVSSAVSPSVCSSDHASVEARPSRHASRRQLMLDNPLLDHQAKEGNEGSSVHGSSNSEDDQYCAHFLIVSYCH